MGFQTQTVRFKKKFDIVEKRMSSPPGTAKSMRPQQPKGVYHSKSRGGSSMYSMYKHAGFESDSAISIDRGEVSRMLNKNSVNSNKFFILDRKHLEKLSKAENCNIREFF